jgi:glutamate racemase
MKKSKPIGIFDSGYGGLTVFKEIKKQLPQHDFVYLGDNARVPYGTRSFETVYNYTWESVKYLFDEYDCPLIILACNTASAKALKSIQRNNLTGTYKEKKVLGVIRPTTEVIGNYSASNHIGIFATNGTVNSNSYPIEIERFFPNVNVFQQACPMLVPLVENKEHLDRGADYFIKKYIDLLLEQNTDIDTILLACTHYPLMVDQIKSKLDPKVEVISQGELVAKSLMTYLERHDEIDSQVTRNGLHIYLTTDITTPFDLKASEILGEEVESIQIQF